MSSAEFIWAKNIAPVRGDELVLLMCLCDYACHHYPTPLPATEKLCAAMRANEMEVGYTLVSLAQKGLIDIDCDEDSEDWFTYTVLIPERYRDNEF